MWRSSSSKQLAYRTQHRSFEYRDGICTGRFRFGGSRTDMGNLGHTCSSTNPRWCTWLSPTLMAAFRLFWST